MLEPGFIAIRRGIPWNRGIWKHRIVDAPESNKFTFIEQTILRAGEAIRLQCPVPLKYGPLLCGESGDSFVVSRRIYMRNSQAITTKTPLSDPIENFAVSRIGYRQLYCASWLVQKTKSCDHGEKLHEKIALYTGCVAVSGVGNLSKTDLEGFLVIYLTARDKVARWRALISAYEQKEIELNQHVMIRTGTCCLQCAIDQALRTEGIWRLVL
jgi:hypothetical protein